MVVKWPKYLFWMKYVFTHAPLAVAWVFRWTFSSLHPSPSHQYVSRLTIVQTRRENGIV